MAKVSEIPSIDVRLSYFSLQMVSILLNYIFLSSFGLLGMKISLPKIVFHCSLIAPGLANSISLVTSAEISGDFSLLLIIALIRCLRPSGSVIDRHCYSFSNDQFLFQYAPVVYGNWK